MLLPAFVMALEEDKNAPLSIKADQVFLNHRSGTNTYKGNVKLVQGTSELTADAISVSFDEADQVDKIVAKGIPACYKTLFDKEKPQVVAVASIMEYCPKKGTLVLQNNAKITEGENSFEGSHIEYNIHEKKVTSATAKDGQIHIMLAPHEHAKS